MFKSYLKIAVRNLLRNKIYALINVVGLALGLTAVLLIMLYTKDELSFDKFHKEVNLIYRIGIDNMRPDGSLEGRMGNVGYFQAPRFSASVPEISSYVQFVNDYRNVKRAGEVKSVEVHFADSNFFNFFSFPLISGNATTALSQPKSVVISETLAKEYFGTVDAVGKTIEFGEGEKFDPYQVTGVAADCPLNSSIRFNMLMPIELPADRFAEGIRWFNSFQSTFVRLSAQADPAVVEKKMQQVFEKEAATAMLAAKERFNFNNTYIHRLQPYTDIHLSEDWGPSNGMIAGSKPLYSYILSGIALFILGIACINFINLTIARSVRRAREIGIRKVIGGNRRQLILQFLGESFLLCGIAFLLAIVLVQLLLPTFNQLSEKSLSLSYLLDAKLVAGYLGAFLITGLLAGFYPAFVLSGFQPIQTLYSRFGLSNKNYLQRSLVVFQFALASLMIIATLVIYLQFNFLTHKDLGYDPSNIVLLPKASLKSADVRFVRETLLQHPSVLAVAAKNGGMNTTLARVNGTEEIRFVFETIDDDYLNLLKVPVVKGRNFAATSAADSNSAVLVNESFVQKAGWKDPLGQTVDFWYNNKKYTVVGVVKDFHFGSLANKIEPLVYTMAPERSRGRLLVRIQPGSAATSLPLIAASFRKQFPLSPYEYQFQDDSNKKQYKQESKWKQMMLFGAVVTLFISCIGLFGLSVFSAERRTREIGIRKTLGASVFSVVRLLSNNFLKLVLIALLLAIPAGWWLSNHWLAAYPYRINLSWWIFAGPGFFVLFIAVITISFQSWRAARMKPVKSLREA